MCTSPVIGKLDENICTEQKNPLTIGRILPKAHDFLTAFICALKGMYNLYLHFPIILKRRWPQEHYYLSPQTHTNLTYSIDHQAITSKKISVHDLGRQNIFKEDSSRVSSYEFIKNMKQLHLPHRTSFSRLNSSMRTIDPISSTIQVNFFFIVVRTFNMRSILLTGFQVHNTVL